jgi:glycosyltransferase involved in cell wall biosynthesis
MGHGSRRAGDQLHVGMLAPISWRVPPRHYGPWERVTSILTEGLVAHGVDVTLFATADSITSARLHATASTGYSEDPALDAKVFECLHNAAVFERAAQFDVIHNQFDFSPLCYSRLVETPVVTTIHGLHPQQVLKVYEAYDDRVHYVAVSDAHRHPKLSYVATIHHGIPLEEFAFRPVPGDYLLFFGRIHPDKGTHEAVEVARRAERPLVLAGIIADADYWRSAVEPFVDGSSVRYVESVGPAERNQLLGGALALLHLIGFEEPFGLSVVEALAAGTPTITYRKGSMPEIVRDGVTGFLVEDVDAAVAAVDRVAELHRRDCRADAVARFSAGRMVDEYLRLYRSLVEKVR